MPLKPGDHVDRYAIQDLLGAGGMGEVYRAIDERLQRAVALKILHPGEAGTPESSTTSGAARLLREARAAAALEHPNVVAIYDVGEVEEPEELRGTPYLAMELIRGESLRERVGEPGVPVAERVRWLVDVAKALGAAHQRGLVHRDVKPENVMIRDDGTVKVLDFGIAKRSHGAVDSTASTDRRQVRSTTGQGVLVGTPYYMSPEQMRGESLDGRSDQFSWGVMAYELLAGVPPWRTDGDALNLVAEVLSHDPEPPSALDPSVPKPVSDVVMRAIAKARDARFPSMEHLVRALLAPPEAFDETDPNLRVGEAAPTRVSKETSRPLAPADAISASRPRPSRRRAWAAAALAAAGIALVGALAWQRRGTPTAVRVPSSGAAPSAVAGAGACTSNAACVEANGGKPFRCRKEDGACVALASEDCRVLADAAALRSDTTIWIGSMFPLTGPDADAYGITNAHAVDLARQDFVQTMGSFAEGSATVRPLGVVSCDDVADARRAATHLVADVGVAAVIGMHSGAETIDVTPAVLFPKRVLLVAPLTTTALVTAMPQPPDAPRLVWRTTYNINDTARPLASLVADVLEPSMHGRGHPLRVAVVRVRTAGALAFAASLFTALRFNGKSALENGADYREVVVEDPSAPGAKPDYAGAVTELATFLPDIVVFQGPGAIVKNVVAPLEARWPAGRPRPAYPTMTVLPPEVFDLVGTSAERRRRFFGLTTVSTTEPNAKFVMHYNEAFADKITRTISPNSSYDAFYVLAYAAYALKPDQPATGEALARAVPRLLPPGKPIGVGPTNIFDAYTTLSRGGQIDLDGATGHLDFDPATGEAPVDMAILCVAADEKGHAADSVESGLVYDATAKKLVGTLKCP